MPLHGLSSSHMRRCVCSYCHGSAVEKLSGEVAAHVLSHQPGWHLTASWGTETGTSESVEGQYSADYEASLNPWTDWRQKERQSRRRRLGLVDRFMYEAGQAVYGTWCAPAPWLACTLSAMLSTTGRRLSHLLSGRTCSPAV